MPPLVDSPLSTKKGKGEKDKKQKEKGKKGKDGNNKAAAKGEKETAKVPLALGWWRWAVPAWYCHPPGLSPQEWKGSKKKRELPKELRQDPPILRVLGSGRVLLEPLLMGEPLVSTVCNFGVIRTMESDRLTFFRVYEGP